MSSFLARCRFDFSFGNWRRIAHHRLTASRFDILLLAVVCNKILLQRQNVQSPEADCMWGVRGNFVQHHPPNPNAAHCIEPAPTMSKFGVLVMVLNSYFVLKCPRLS